MLKVNQGEVEPCFVLAFCVSGANALKKAGPRCLPLTLGHRQPWFSSLAPLLPPRRQLSGSKLCLFSAVAKSQW